MHITAAEMLVPYRQWNTTTPAPTRAHSIPVRTLPPLSPPLCAVWHGINDCRIGSRQACRFDNCAQKPLVPAPIAQCGFEVVGVRNRQSKQRYRHRQYCPFTDRVMRWEQCHGMTYQAAFIANWIALRFEPSCSPEPPPKMARLWTPRWSSLRKSVCIRCQLPAGQLRFHFNTRLAEQPSMLRQVRREYRQRSVAVIPKKVGVFQKSVRRPANRSSRPPRNNRRNNVPDCGQSIPCWLRAVARVCLRWAVNSLSAPCSQVLRPLPVRLPLAEYRAPSRSCRYAAVSRFKMRCRR